jgi:hypothetical protein
VWQACKGTVRPSLLVSGTIQPLNKVTHPTTQLVRGRDKKTPLCCVSAGAWCGYGFHEDGIKAAVEAVTALGARIPWTCRPTSPKVTLADSWFMGLFDRFAKVGWRRCCCS